MYCRKINREIKLCFTVPGNFPCTITKVTKITALTILICRAEKLTKAEMKIIRINQHSEGKCKPTSPPSSQKGEVSLILSLILKILLAQLLQFSNKKCTLEKQSFIRKCQNWLFSISQNHPNDDQRKSHLVPFIKH